MPPSPDGAASGGEWISRPYAPADEQGILDLCSRVFGSEMPPDLWRWQFPDNPFATAVVQVAEDSGGRIIGHYSQVPVPLWRDGESQLGSYSILSMIDPGHQRKGILKRLAADAESRLVEQGILTGATFLNENSYPVYTGQLEWTEVYKRLPVVFLVFDVGAVASRYTGSVLGRVVGFLGKPIRSVVFRQQRAVPDSLLEIRKAARIDPRVDALWSELRTGFRYATDRTSLYLAWRIDQNPRQYQIYIAENGNELVGLAVTRIDQKFGQRIAYLVEFLISPGRLDAAQALLQSALGDLRKEGCGMITALAPEPGGQRELLRHCGFRDLPPFLAPHAIHFCVKDRHRPVQQQALADPAGWWVSWSDHDVV
ncbi:MAG: GNAT family N-acetyltransferase [Acidobacteriota bacterium]